MLSRHRVPALTEVLLDVSYHLALQAHLHVVPVRSKSQVVVGGVPSIALECAQIDAADVCDAAVHSHSFLMVIVTESRPPVELASDAWCFRQDGCAYLLDVSDGGP